MARGREGRARKCSGAFHGGFRPLLGTDHVEDRVAASTGPSSNTSTDSVEANIAFVAIADQFLDNLGCHLSLTFNSSRQIQVFTRRSVIVGVVGMGVDLRALGGLFGGVLGRTKRVSSIPRVGRNVFSGR